MAEHAPKYLPAVWMDEENPSCADDPSDYIEHDAEHGWLVRLPKGDPDRDDDIAEDLYVLPISPGQIVMWCALTTFDDFVISVVPWTSVRGGVTASSYHVPEVEAATRANCLRHAEGDYEDIFPTLGELVENGNPELAGGPLPAGRHTIEAWHWSNEIPFRFDLVDGVPKFVRVEGQA